jgi:hypothetical protein
MGAVSIGICYINAKTARLSDTRRVAYARHV